MIMPVRGATVAASDVGVMSGMHDIGDVGVMSGMHDIGT